MTRRPKSRRGGPSISIGVQRDAAIDGLPTGRSRRGGPGRGQGAKPLDGTPRTEVRRFRCTEAQAAEIDGACESRGRDLSDVARELLLAWARGAQ